MKSLTRFQNRSVNMNVVKGFTLALSMKLVIAGLILGNASQAHKPVSPKAAPPVKAAVRTTPFFSTPAKWANKSVCITMDMEGEWGTSRLLNSLKKHQVKMTFFLCGSWAAYHPKLIKRMLAEGHEIGNHTNGHRIMTKLTDNDAKLQLMYLEMIVKKKAGVTTKPLFRPPYGITDDRTRKIIHDLGYTIIMWNRDPKDSVTPYPGYPAMLQRMNRMTPGDVIVLHSTHEDTIRAVINYLPKMKKAGLSGVTISKMMALEESGKKKAAAKAASSRARIR